MAFMSALFYLSSDWPFLIAQLVFHLLICYVTLMQVMVKLHDIEMPCLT